MKLYLSEIIFLFIIKQLFFQMSSVTFASETIYESFMYLFQSKGVL